VSASSAVVVAGVSSLSEAGEVWVLLCGKNEGGFVELVSRAVGFFFPFFLILLFSAVLLSYLAALW
jgi:hypothetical protein